MVLVKFSHKNERSRSQDNFSYFDNSTLPFRANSRFRTENANLISSTRVKAYPPLELIKNKSLWTYYYLPSTDTTDYNARIRGCLHGSGEPQVGEVTRLGVVTHLSISPIWSLILIWSRLHDRWGDMPHFTSPMGHLWSPTSMKTGPYDVYGQAKSSVRSKMPLMSLLFKS